MSPTTTSLQRRMSSTPRSPSASSGFLKTSTTMASPSVRRSLMRAEDEPITLAEKNSPTPAPCTPAPPQSQDLLDIVHPPDQDMENCENEDDLEWKPVRRLAHWDRRNKMGVIKGYTKQRQERRLSVSKHVILEDDELSDHAESDAQSGKEIASMLCNMPQEKLLEVVQTCPASMLQQFMPNVAAPITAAVSRRLPRSMVLL